MSLKLAIYGYDTDIAKLVLETIDEQNFELDDLFFLTPLSGEYDAVSVRGKNYFVEAVDEFDFSKADVALFLSTKDESERLVLKAKEKGCVVVDNSHLFSGDKNTCTIVPQINDYDVKKAIENKLVIPALAPSVELILALSVLHDEFGVDKANATALESVSEFGQLGTQTLAHESTLLLNGMASDHQGFKAQLAFNLHSHIGEVLDTNFTDHESTIISETQRVLGKFTRGLNVTSVLVPVFYGHTMVVNVELEQAATLSEVQKAFADSEYTELCENDRLLSPVEDSINQRKVLVSRVRQTEGSKKSFSFELMMDNSRFGEAISLVEIIKLIAKNN